MNLNKLKYLLLIFILLTSAIGIRAQTVFQTYMDIGKNNVSEGVFLKNAYRGSHQHLKFKVEAGIQFDLVSNNPNVFTGLDFSGSKNILVRKFPLEIKGFFMLNRFSDLMYETDWGIRIETRKLEHFVFELGTNFKTYSINSDARDTYNISRDNSKLRENFNLMYLVKASLKPHTSDWNLSLSCTNIDYYMINQSTNPVFNLQSIYKIRSNLSLYLDAWYKQAGIFNISANYFGYFFRGGVIWKI